MNYRLLSDMTAGQKGRVTEVRSCGDIRRRFTDLGLIRGARVCCVMSTAKSMKAYEIRGAVIAIRNRDAKGVSVEAEYEDGSSCR